MQFRWLGLTEYENSLEIQKKIAREVSEGISQGVCLGFEYDRTITLGIRSEPRDLLQSNQNFRIYNADRGGQAILHNKGQLVVYPILHLPRMGLSVREYIRILEQSCLNYLSAQNIEAVRGLSEPGIFVRGKKIAAIGTRVRSGVTTHGICINIHNELEDFGVIRVCGQNTTLTSIQELQPSQKLNLMTEFGLFCPTFLNEIETQKNCRSGAPQVKFGIEDLARST